MHLNSASQHNAPLRLIAAAACLVALCGPWGAATAAAGDGGKVSGVDYPADEVELGNGWDSMRVAKSTGMCIVFQQGERKAQTVAMNMHKVTSRYQLERMLGISASASYKGVAGSISSKADFASKARIETAGTTVAVLATVDSGPVFAAPPKDGASGSKVEALIAQGLTPDAVNAALGVTAAQVGERMRGVLPDLISPEIAARRDAFDIEKLNAAAEQNGSQFIRLTEEARELAETDAARFRQVCGDSYVAAIHRGGQMSILFSFRTTDSEKQKSIDANLQGSGWGVTADATMKSKIREAAQDTETHVAFHQTGGRGDTIPFDLDSLNRKIAEFKSVVDQAPKNYYITLGAYEDLVNWPDIAAPEGASKGEIANLIYASSVWTTLDEILREVLEQGHDPFGTPGYLFGRGVARAALVEKQTEVSKRADEARREIRACLRDGCKASTLLGRNWANKETLTREEMAIRAMLPLPIPPQINPSARTADAYPIRNSLYERWIQRVNEDRCNPPVPNYQAPHCLTVAEVEAIKKNIKVDEKPRVAIVIDQPVGACMFAESAGDDITLKTNCDLTDPRSHFRWDAARRFLIHEPTGQCVRVDRGSLHEGRKIVLYNCKGEVGRRWLLKGQPGWIKLLNVNSRQYIQVDNPRNGSGISQKIEKQKKATPWRFVME